MHTQMEVYQVRWIGKRVLLDGARETLVLLRVIVLQRDLQFNSLCELPLLLLRVLKHGSDCLGQGVPV